jgi:hypothetical protein
MTEIFPHQDRIHLAQAVMRVLSDWGLEPDEQARLLGFPPETKARALTRFRNGEAFPDDKELLLRSQHLLAIEHSLATAFPHNPMMGNYWVTTVNPQFGGMRPLDVMLEHGVDGLTEVARHLDGSSDWG